MVVVVVTVILWAHVLHLVHTSALGATLDGSVAGGCEPDDDVGVCWVAGAADVLLVAEGLDDDWVFESAFGSGSISCDLRTTSCFGHTFARGVEWAHIEDIDALHLSEDFQTLETSGLLEICGDGTGLSTRWEEVALALDVCIDALYQPAFLPISFHPSLIAHLRMASTPSLARRSLGPP